MLQKILDSMWSDVHRDSTVQSNALQNKKMNERKKEEEEKKGGEGDAVPTEWGLENILIMNIRVKFHIYLSCWHSQI